MTTSNPTREAYLNWYGTTHGIDPEYANPSHVNQGWYFWKAATTHILTVLQSEGMVGKVAEAIDYDICLKDGNFYTNAKAAIIAIIEELKL